uniref:CDP-diacylglycerol--inositol 3-phosphatidyltransferase n=1 Tax=Euperipatoides kanangrensis TaxID=488523 RepID=A0A0F7VHK5_9BILA|nr:Eka-PI synthase protein [Euperipatoides kanangrensis]
MQKQKKKLRDCVGSKFGAMLDMLTDRCATMCLLVTLAHFYPSYMFFFQLSMALDIASHWLHLHSSVVQGGASHKLIDLSANPILRIYYHSKIVLFCMCAGNELFYCMLYLLHFTEGPIIWFIGLWKLICILTFPVSIVKSGISVVQLIAASKNMVSLDMAEREKAQAKTE